VTTFEKPTYAGCHVCSKYAIERQHALGPAMAREHVRTGEPMAAMARRFMTGVHARHLSGPPIMPGGAR
jgi:hypothetical protein